MFSLLVGYPGTSSWRQVVKQGPVEPEGALEVAAVQAQQLVSELCASGGLDEPRRGSVWISECFGLSTAGTMQQPSQCR